MFYLQVDPTVVGSLKSDWSILIAIAILAFIQGYKIYLDNRSLKKRSVRDAEVSITMNNINSYLKILADQYTEEVTAIQMPIILDEFIGHTKQAVLCHASAIIAANDIKNNRKETETKIDHFICNRYKELENNLSRFKWNDKEMSQFINQELKEKIVSNVIEIVLKDRDTEAQRLNAYRNLGSTINQRFDQLTNSAKTKAYGQNSPS